MYSLREGQEKVSGQLGGVKIRVKIALGEVKNCTLSRVNKDQD